MSEDLLLAMLLNGAITGGLAGWWKGRSRLVWFLLGAVTLGLALLFLIFMPKNKEEFDRRSVASGKGKICVGCKEVIKHDAVVCKHCGTNTVAFQREKMDAEGS